jgi:hypothetical protein
MFRKVNLVTVLAALLAFSNLASGQQTVPLNTGYKHSVPAPYPTVITPTSLTQDVYWINLQSHPGTTPPTGPSWVLEHTLPWAPPMSNSFGVSSWIGARNTVAGGGSTSLNPGYTIFRKCYCLLPGFNQASLSFKVLADDKATFWFNSISNPLGTVSGNLYGPPFSGGTTNQNYFHAGRNCFYLLLEDQGGYMGFDLAGEIKANGLLPTVGSWNGKDISFEPCPCSSGQGPVAVGNPKSVNMTAQAGDNDQQVINDIVKFAEARRATKGKDK